MKNKGGASRVIRWVCAPLISVLLVGACAGDGGRTPTSPLAPAPSPPAPSPPPTPEPPDPGTATYDFVYEPRISGNSVAIALGAVPMPDGVDLSLSAALLAHPADEAPWEEGGFLSEEMRVLAETGNAMGLIEAAKARGHQVIATTSGEIGALLLQPVLELTLENPCVSQANKIVPSPDWFIGFSNVCTVDEEGNWRDEVAFTLVAYDAGIAEGEDYVPNFTTVATDPPEPIAELDIEPFSPAGTPVAIITATLRK